MKSPAKPASQASVESARLPLTTLLSQVLVAFTIEFDNEFEGQMPHRTTISRKAGVGSAPWLGSLAMWSNFIRFVGDGVSVREFQRLARLNVKSADIWLTRMESWWGYVTVSPDSTHGQRSPPRSDWMIRPTPGGQRAQEVWRPLFGVIEGRWRERYGEGEIVRLRDSLSAVVSQLNFELPEYLPILRYGLFSEVALDQERASASSVEGAGQSLSALLSKVLIVLAMDFERDWPLALAISANLLRVLNEEGVQVRDLPRLSGVSKEATAMALGFLEKRGFIEMKSGATGRRKLVRLTSTGLSAQIACRQRLGAVELSFQSRIGKGRLDDLRESLQTLRDRRDGEQPVLGQGLIPHPGGWRANKLYLAQTLAMVRDPAGTLPHYPMVLHRGGYPDGS